MNFEFSALTDTGRKRAANEDSYLVDEELGLFVVADGMGGHAAGEVASALAVKTVSEYVTGRRKEIEKLADGGLKQRTKLRRLLRDAVKKASQAIHADARKDSKLRGMGTTLTIMLIAGHRGYVAHVGDSRLYLNRHGDVHQITTDHSLVNEMIRAGRLKGEDAEKSKFSNALTRAVGVYPNVEVDTLDLELLSGDSFLICSDGLHGYFVGDSLSDGFSEPLETRTQWFIDFANGAGGKDNITAVVVEVGDLDDAEAGVRLKLTFDTLHKIPLFQHLTYPELVRVINVSRAREVPAEELLIEEGADGDALYVVLSGRVAVERHNNVIALLGPGRHFGEMSLVDNQPRSATVRTMDRTVLIRIIRSDFYEMLKQDSVLAVKLLWNFIQTLSARLRAANPDEDLESFNEALDTIEERPPTRQSGEMWEALANTQPGVEIPDDLRNTDED